MRNLHDLPKFEDRWSHLYLEHGKLDLERRTRIACRNAFYESKLMSRILPDIAEVLNAPDDPREYPDELEGRAVSLAD
jgi:hypothetical protein